MLPEDLAPYFLLCACLPKDNFFTASSLLLENETAGCFCIRKQQTMLSRAPRFDFSVKNYYDIFLRHGQMGDKTVAFLPTLPFQVKAVLIQRQICSQGLESDVFYAGKMQRHEAPTELGAI